MLGACQVVDVILQLLQELVIAGYKENELIFRYKVSFKI